MSNIDVSGLLSDPFIAGDEFAVIRRVETVNDFGESEVTTETIGPVYGSVFPTGDNSLVRQDAYDAQGKSIKVITSFRLRGVSKEAGVNYKPDLILWGGDHYQVKTLNDWTKFGAGFVEAECSSVDFVDQPPQEPE